MLKKGLIIGGGILLLTTLIFGRQTWSYVHTAMGKVRATVKDNVPVEFEIDRARDMIKALEPQIRENQKMIAKEEVAVEKLVSQLATKQETLAESKSDILRLRDDLQSARSTYVYAGETYSEFEVREDLADRFERFEVEQATADKLAQIVKARQKGLSAARGKLSEMLSAKRQLEVDVENLEARLRVQEVEKAGSQINIDDSQLARTRELIEEINTRLDVDDRLLDSGTRYDGIQLHEPESKDNADIVEEVTRFFDEQPVAGAVAGH